MAINNKGFAIIFVMIFLAIILTVIADIIYQAEIRAKESLVDQEQIIAKTAVQTGVEFAKFLLILNKIAAGYQNNGIVSMPKNFYTILNGQSIGNDIFSQMEKLTDIDINQFMSPELRQALQAMRGSFVLNISSENAKFNLNLLENIYADVSYKALLRIFSNPDTERFISLYNYSPQDLVDNLKNYIANSTIKSDFNLSAYTKLGLKYLPKNGALESLEELRRIPGFEIDDIYNMFAPYFTVWPITSLPNSLNINSGSSELIATLLTPQGQIPAAEAWDKFDDYRNNNTYAQNNINSWLQKNLPSFANDLDAADISKNILGVNDTIFKIKCRGSFHDIDQTIVVVLQQNLNNTSAPLFSQLYSQWIY